MKTTAQPFCREQQSTRRAGLPLQRHLFPLGVMVLLTSPSGVEAKLTMFGIAFMVFSELLSMLAGQWRKGLTSMSFPRWPRSAAAQGATKAKSVPAVDPADIDIELADFQGMPRCYDSGAQSLRASYNVRIVSKEHLFSAMSGIKHSL